MKQTTFAALAFDKKKKQTRRERFLSEIEAIVLLAVIDAAGDDAADSR